MHAVLTDRQKEILDFIVQYIQEHEFAPTLREIGDKIDIRSTNGVVDHLRALVRKGWILRWEQKSRGIVLTKITKKVYGLGLFMPEESQAFFKLQAVMLKSMKHGFSKNFERKLGELTTPAQGARLVLAEMNEIMQGEEPNL